MNIHDATEIAYKNGYEKGYADGKKEVDKAEAEIERLQDILDSYALQYGTVMDKHIVIERARQEVAREIFEKIEESIATHAYTSKSEDYMDGAFDTIEWVDSKIDELKKKYTEDQNNEN